jgi:thioredoxin 1
MPAGAQRVRAKATSSTPGSKRVMKVDFDTQKQWVTHFRAPGQSTLILFHGDEQIWFSVGETRRQVIFDVLEKADKRAAAST